MAYRHDGRLFEPGATSGPITVVKLWKLVSSGHQSRLSADHGKRHVGRRWSQSSGGFEHGELFAAAGRILEQVNAVVGFVGTRDQKIKIAVGIPIHRHGPGPKSYA